MAVPLLFSRGRAFRASADRFIPPLCSGTAKPALQSLTDITVSTKTLEPMQKLNDINQKKIYNRAAVLLFSDSNAVFFYEV